MAAKTRIDKGLHSIKKAISLHKDEAKLQIIGDTIVVNEKKPELIGTIFYILFLVIGPVILVITSLDYPEKWKLAIISAAPFIFGWNLIRMTKGSNIVLIDLKAEHIIKENFNPILKGLFPKKTIAFNELKKVEVIEQIISGRYRNTIWHQLVVTDKDDREIALADFDYKYPQTTIATKVKFLIQQIIDTQKDRPVRVE